MQPLILGKPKQIGHLFSYDVYLAAKMRRNLAFEPALQLIGNHIIRLNGYPF